MKFEKEESKVPLIGTTIKMLNCDVGCCGAENRIGVVTDKTSISGLCDLSEGFNIELDDGEVWRVNGEVWRVNGEYKIISDIIKTPKVDSWCVKVTEENVEIVKDWMGDGGWCCSPGAFYGINTNGVKYGHMAAYVFDRVISTEEFYEKIGYNKLIKEDPIEPRSSKLESMPWYIKTTPLMFLGVDFASKGSDITVTTKIHDELIEAMSAHVPHSVEMKSIPIFSGYKIKSKKKGFKLSKIENSIKF